MVTVEEYLKWDEDNKNKGSIKLKISLYDGSGGHLNVEAIIDYADRDSIADIKERLFIKAYDDDSTARPGVQTQTGDNIDLTGQGYGQNSTVSVSRHLVQNIVGIRRELLEDYKYKVYPTNDNWLDMRRDNLTVEWEDKKRKKYTENVRYFKAWIQGEIKENV